MNRLKQYNPKQVSLVLQSKLVKIRQSEIPGNSPAFVHI